MKYSIDGDSERIIPKFWEQKGMNPITGFIDRDSKFKKRKKRIKDAKTD